MIDAFGSRLLVLLPFGVAFACGQGRFSHATEQDLLVDSGSMTGRPSPKGTGVGPLMPNDTPDPYPNDTLETDDVGNSLADSRDDVPGGPNPSGSNSPQGAAGSAGSVQAECGNGITEADEACDDGNQVDDDGCTNGCTLPSCGDGILQQPREECDDGNDTGDDKCTNQCTLPSCGDGIVSTGESCEDGNLVDGDGCSATCQSESCGDGIKASGEWCDDGNLVDGDGCSATCQKEGCGDGITSDGEACDDGNAVDGDGCSSSCQEEVCGDRIVSGDETCDDGNAVDGDGCSSSCQEEVCGDRIVSGDETCDDGNRVDGDGCSALCEEEVCGDGKTTGNEECDDGNAADNDGCSGACLEEYCGDGIVQPPREQCEDLNTVDTDVCRNGCMHAASLNSLSGSCAQTDQITQTVCMVATANWCAQYGNTPIAGMVTGVKGDNEYTVGCIVGFQRREVPTSQLDQCPGGRQQSPACLDQIHAACVGLGFDRGFYLGTGSGGTYAVACDAGTTATEGIAGCNGIADTSPVPVTCAQALSAKCGSGKGGMIQARAASDRVTYTCIDLSLTGSVRQF